MKKLWSVELRDEVVVLAETREEAEDLAREASHYDLHLDADAHEMSTLPWGWEEDSLPYGEADNKSIAEWREELRKNG